jgi:hypothetical protein
VHFVGYFPHILSFPWLLLHNKTVVFWIALLYHCDTCDCHTTGMNHLKIATICFVMSICPSVRPHGTTRLPLYGFSWNFKFDILLFLTTRFLQCDSLCLLTSMSLARHKVCNFPDILTLFVECQIFLTVLVTHTHTHIYIYIYIYIWL